MANEDDNQSKKNNTLIALILVVFLIIAVIIFFLVWYLESKMNIEIPYIEDSEIKMGVFAAVISAVITSIMHFSGGQFQKWTDALYEDKKK